MKEPFKVGDRVRVYGSVVVQTYSGDSQEIKPLVCNLATVQEVWSRELMLHQENSAFRIFAHPKQCRRLVKKKRRRLWLGGTGAEDSVPRLVACSLVPRDGFVEFVEVKK